MARTKIEDLEEGLSAEELRALTGGTVWKWAAKTVSKGLEEVDEWADKEGIGSKDWERLGKRAAEDFPDAFGKLTDALDSAGKSIDSTAKKACFLTTACTQSRGLPDDCEELETLRAFRDGVLAARPEGLALIARYYAVAPAIVARIDAEPDAARRWDELYEQLIRPCVDLVRAGETELALTHYASWVRALEA